MLLYKKDIHIYNPREKILTNIYLHVLSINRHNFFSPIL